LWNVLSRKLLPLLTSLEIPQAGFHAFRHFNVSLMDALRVPLKTIQERIGHALTGSFTLDVYGGKPEWERNLEAARLAGRKLRGLFNGRLQSGKNRSSASRRRVSEWKKKKPIILAA
jgi:hypothetical protein